MTNRNKWVFLGVGFGIALVFFAVLFYFGIRNTRISVLIFCGFVTSLALFESAHGGAPFFRTLFCYFVYALATTLAGLLGFLLWFYQDHSQYAHDIGWIPTFEEQFGIEGVSIAVLTASLFPILRPRIQPVSFPLIIFLISSLLLPCLVYLLRNSGLNLGNILAFLVIPGTTGVILSLLLGKKEQQPPETRGLLSSLLILATLGAFACLIFSQEKPFYFLEFTLLALIFAILSSILVGRILMGKFRLADFTTTLIATFVSALLPLLIVSFFLSWGELPPLPKDYILFGTIGVLTGSSLQITRWFFKKVRRWDPSDYSSAICLPPLLSFEAMVFIDLAFSNAVPHSLEEQAIGVSIGGGIALILALILWGFTKIFPKEQE